MAAALAGTHQKMLGADKNCDTKSLVAEMWRIGVKPHGAKNTARGRCQGWGPNNLCIRLR